METSPSESARLLSCKRTSSGTLPVGSGSSPGRLTLATWAIAKRGTSRKGADSGPISMLGLILLASCIEPQSLGSFRALK